MNIPFPYQRVVDLIKERYADLGILALMNILVMIVFQGVMFLINIVLQFLGNFLYIMMMIGVFLIMVSPIFGGILIIVSILLMIMLFIVIFAVFFLLISMVLGWNIVISRVVIDIRDGNKCDLGPIFDHVKVNWRHYLKRGMGVASFQLLILTPIMTTLIMAPFIVSIVIGATLTYLNPDIGPMFIVVFFFIGYLLLIIIAVFFSPIMQFVLDNGSVRIANGQGSWEGMIDSIIDMFRRRRLFGYYYIGSLLIQMLVFFVFPLAIIISFVLPIVTRAYIVVNDDL
ncbi:MAG: hypothetical protein QCI82_03050 [Candidatus Thermoplasmatota archaeon]|nr:hypothetical protein [Candidatus Thermoplasmatota archaeon]